MDIGLIAGKVKENTRGDSFILSDGTVGIPHMMLLFLGYLKGKASLELKGFTSLYEHNILTISGRGTFPDSTDCPVELVFLNDENDILQVEMPRQYLLPAFSELRLSCRCAYEREAWQVTFERHGIVSAARLLSAGISYLGISLPPSCFGDKGDITDIRFRFELPFEETGEENDIFINYNRKKYLSLYFETDMRLDLSGIFENGNQVGLGIQSFQVEKFGDRYGFSFKGDMKIWELEIPFMIRYGSGSLTLSTIKNENSPIAIPSVNDLGKIVGLDDLHLPESLSSLTAFTCETISLSVSEDLKHLLSFSVVVTNKNVWQIAQTPDIHITNLTIGFTKNTWGSEIFISGELDLAGWALTLAAAYHTQDGWVFRAYISPEVMPADEREKQMKLSSLFDKLCDFLGFGEIPFPLPDPEIIGAMASYSLKAKQFSAHMEIGELVCDFRYLFGSSRSYRLSLSAGYELSLFRLPIVGEDLHLLDHISIRDIRLESDPESTILYLDFAGERLKLKLAGGEKKDGENLPQRETEAVTGGECPAYAAREEGMKLLWFRLEKHFSVFTIHRIGIGFDGKKITFAFDAELTVCGFQLAMEGLEISAEVADRPGISFDLSGLFIGYENPAFALSGGFRHSVCNDVSSYDGSLLVKTKGISVLAVGSYSEGSFLAYGMLKAKIGGPPAFSITGLAVGFGMNKYLMLPDIEKVEEFPLVAAAVKPAFSGEQLLEGLKNKTTALIGQNFLAAGIRFHSFGMAYSFALLTVSFGQHLEIALSGICEMTAPPMEAEGSKEKVHPAAKAKLALKAALLPESGVFSVQAQLLPDSYILSESCKLTGGFACCIWFGGEHRDDFVITLGGYRKGYRKPEHYPDVPRLGFRWNVTKELTMSGEMYFSLTPSMLCAGGRLEAVFVMGALKAWFTAYADFEMGWKPFCYDICVGISLGASITLDLWLFSKTFTLELAVDLHIWGPEFHGRAKITWWVISFTISFATGPEGEKTIDWSEVKRTFLQGNMGEDKSAGNAEAKNIISVHAAEGMIGKAEREGKEIEILHADTAKLNVESLVPGAFVTLNHTKITKTEKDREQEALGVYPMGENVLLKSHMDISLKRESEERPITYQVEEIRRSLPKALWAAQKKTVSAGEAAEEMIRDVPVGVLVSFGSEDFVLFPAKKFLTQDLLSEYEKTEKKFRYTSVLVPDITGDDTDFAVFRAAAEKIPDKVGAFIKEMEGFGFDFDIVPDLTIMSENAMNLFDEEFRLGQYTV